MKRHLRDPKSAQMSFAQPHTLCGLPIDRDRWMYPDGESVHRLRDDAKNGDGCKRCVSSHCGVPEFHRGQYVETSDGSKGYVMALRTDTRDGDPIHYLIAHDREFGRCEAWWGETHLTAIKEEASNAE